MENEVSKYLIENGQFVALIGINLASISTVLSLLIFFRSESRNDYRHLDTKIDLIRKESKENIEAMRIESQAFLKSIQDEMKDFHGRLCAIEERYREKK